MRLADAPQGAIVRVGDRWGVVCIEPVEAFRQRGARVVDFWDGGREYVRSSVVVEVEQMKPGVAA